MKGMGGRCEFWLPNKRRFCANSPVPHSRFCGNHDPASEARRVPCPIDPSHSVLTDNLELHLQKCPARKQAMQLQSMPFYRKGVNAGGEYSSVAPFVSSEEKRNAIYSMDVAAFLRLVGRIRFVHSTVCGRIRASYVVPEVCGEWLNRQQERKLPFQEKHALQQAAILRNMEAFGILKKKLVRLETPVPIQGMGVDCLSGDEVDDSAVVEFGAGRGYLTQMLVDCYGINKVFLVERRSYKLKADGSLRKIKNMNLKRLRIDIEDLNLNGVESLRGLPYLAIGKHICGPATDLTLRCCLRDHKNTNSHGSCHLKGLALATCCHHLCQWKHYINKKFLNAMGITKDDFHAMTWFTSWAVDADHSSHVLGTLSQDEQPCIFEKRESETKCEGVEGTIKNMKAFERATLGFICKDIIDVGRLLWLEDHGLNANLLKYVSSNVSPENHLLVAKVPSHL